MFPYGTIYPEGSQLDKSRATQPSKELPKLVELHTQFEWAKHSRCRGAFHELSPVERGVSDFRHTQKTIHTSPGERMHPPTVVKPVLNWANVCSRT